jgi:hypothetical protein
MRATTPEQSFLKRFACNKNEEIGHFKRKMTVVTAFEYLQASRHRVGPAESRLAKKGSKSVISTRATTPEQSFLKRFACNEHRQVGHFKRKRTVSTASEYLQASRHRVGPAESSRHVSSEEGLVKPHFDACNHPRTVISQAICMQ